MSILLALLTYLYNPADWQHYPRLAEIRNFTADAFGTVYVVNSASIVELSDEKQLPKKIYTKAEGLPGDIDLGIYDRGLGRLWVTDQEGKLHDFNPQAGFSNLVFLPNSAPAYSLGVSNQHVFLDRGSSVIAVNKRSRQVEDVDTDSVSIRWVGARAAKTDPKDYPALTPYVLIDQRMQQIPYTMVFAERNKAYVAVHGFGYVVFDALAWREIQRYSSPRATGIHSLFAADSSVYAFGSQGVDQIIGGQEKVVHHSFDRWGTTTNPTPYWSKGAMAELRRYKYSHVKLFRNNLFLIKKREADVLNISEKVTSEIETTSWIYDVDYHADSLYLATDDGVFLTLVSEGEPRMLSDQRSKLVGDDVLGIVRGDAARYFWTGRMVVKQVSGAWEYFTAPGFMPVPQEAVAGRDSLIILGGTGGVTLYNPETYFQTYLTAREGLLSEDVTALFVQDSFLWIASDAGLQRFNLNAVLP